MDAETARQERCRNCDIELPDDRVERDGVTFCCDGCAGGGPCTC